jgi:glycosyltransferase involved in cell wall biosynthesis
MRIWFVSIFENTPLDDNKNTRYNSMVKEANRRGHEVVFWSSTFRHNVKKQRFEEFQVEEVNPNLKVKFIQASPYTKNISFKRMFSHHGLSKSMISQFEKETELPDVIMIAFPPISTAYEIVRWAEKKKIPVIADIIDPWPEVFMTHMKGIKKQLAKIFMSPLKKKTTYVINHATAIAAISKQYIDWAKTYNPSIEKTACFYPAVQFEEMKNQLKRASLKIKKDKNNLHIIYAGSLGHSYDIATILEAAAILEEKFHDKIKFTIAGEGPQRSAIENYLLNHSNLEYLGRLPKEQLMEEYYKADIGLTQHISGATQSVTYKLFDLLACGLPIMNSLESEMKAIILNNKTGFHNHPGDAQQLADNIIQCYNDRELLASMKNNALELTAREGDSAVVYAKALDYIESIAQK